MTNNKTIFGFGSLIYQPSLLSTAPNATNITPAYIKGFTRCFNFWDAIGYTKINLDVANEPMCALDVTVNANVESRVNGVAFTVSANDFAQLVEREEGYEVITVPIYDYATDTIIAADGLVFSSNMNNGKYVFGGKAQERYLTDMLAASKLHGDKFYREVLDTTFIENQRLSEISQLASLLA